MNALASYPFRRLADRLHAVAPLLEPEVRRSGRTHQLGAWLFPDELLVIELRRRQGWWAMTLYLDAETGEPREDLDALMQGVQSEHPIIAKVDDLDAVARHVLLIAVRRWRDVLEDESAGAGQTLWATQGLRQLRT